MRVTIEQIAEAAGTSPGTVSRVLNGRFKENRPAVARKADKIRQIARELGYRRNNAARTMATGRFGQVAFVTCGDLGFDWFAPSLLHGIHGALERAKSRLTLHELSGRDFDDVDELPRLFREAAVDGMLLNIDAKLPGSIVDHFDDQPVPSVLLNTRRNTRSVYPDEFGGGRAAARHLVELGFENVGYLMVDDNDRMLHYSRRDRAEGVAAELDERGLSPRRRLLGVPGFQRRTSMGVGVVGDFLDRHADLDAVVCYGPAETSLLVTAAALRGRRVPDDLRVLSFNDKLVHAELGVPIDTLVVPFKQIGERAVEMLYGIVDGNGGRRPEAARVPYGRLYVADKQEMRDLSAGEAAAESREAAAAGLP